MNEKSRFESREFWALIAADTFDPVAERIKSMLLNSDRRLVLLRHYANPNGIDDVRTHVGLRLDDSVESPALTEGGIHISPVGSRGDRFFNVHLAPGLESFGFAADSRTEKALQEDYRLRGEAYDRPVTRVHVDGWPDTASREDRVDIEHWNVHGVCSMTSILFQAHWG